MMPVEEREIAAATSTIMRVRNVAEGWRSRLLVTGNGNPRAILANAITALRHAPEWEGVLGFNAFSLGVTTLRPAPWGGKDTTAWTDQEDRLTADWLQHAGILVNVDIAGQAVQTVARDREFHPVREYLDSLKWDGTKRVDTWLSLYLGAEHADYTAAVGARWLVSAIARVYRPGVKADCCLILEGEQGTYKSTALQTLAGEWFSDDIAEIGTKDAALQSQGVWIVELSELDAMRRPEVSRIKSFMSRATDRFRPPYGKRVIEAPRQCVFCGTVNHSRYLHDDTGGRRFWPVTCGKHINLAELARDRDQLWAEARTRYEAGATWWLDTQTLNAAATEEQDGRYEQDPWQPLIEEFVESRDFVTVPIILAQCVHKPEKEWSQSDQNRVARTLQAMKWDRFRARIDEQREWRYRRRSQ